MSKFFNMMSIQIISVAILLTFHTTNSVRLHKIFQYIDGYMSEHNLKGFLHVGNDYAIYLRAPQPHDKYLIYELYEAKDVPDTESYKPQLLAVTHVPVDYIKEQLTAYRNELYKAKYVDDNVVPGTQTQTLREWQISRALSIHDRPKALFNKAPVMRSVF